MVRFDWKFPVNGEYPAEPAVNKDAWQYDDPGMTAFEVKEWYRAQFDVYACMLRGVSDVVPMQLYYIGGGDFMTDQGQVIAGEYVRSWDSYTEE